MQHDDTNIERLLRQRAGGPPRAAGGPSCGDPELLAAYAEGGLAAAARERFQSHLAACVACQTGVARLVRLAPDQSAAARATHARAPALRHAWMAATRWRWALPALAGVVLVGSVVYYQRSQIVQPRELREPAVLSASRSPAPPVPPAMQEQAPSSNALAREETPAAGVSRRDAESAGVRKEQEQPAVSDARANNAQVYAGDKKAEGAFRGAPAGAPTPAEQARTGAGAGGGVGGVIGTRAVPEAVHIYPVPKVADAGEAVAVIRPFAPVVTPSATQPAPPQPSRPAARPEAQGGQQKPLADAMQQGQVAPSQTQQRAAESTQKPQATGATEQQAAGAPQAKAAGVAQATPQQAAGAATGRGQAELAAQAQPGRMLRYDQAGQAGVGGGAGGGQADGRARTQGNAAAGFGAGQAVEKAANQASPLKRLQSGAYTFELTARGVQRTGAAGVAQKLLAPPAPGSVLDFSVFERNVWVLLPDGRVAHSADAGETWDAAVNTGAGDASQILFSDATTGRVTTRSGAVLVTVDAGRTWRELRD